MAWHERAQTVAGHRWLREEVAEAAREFQTALDERFANWTRGAS